MNAYKINEKGLLPNKSEAFGNFSAKAIFSSTINYIQLPTNLTSTIINYLVYDKRNKTLILKDDRDG